MALGKEILNYNKTQKNAERQVCDELAALIDANLKGAESKIWHRHPVWFLEGNPIVGYSKLKVAEIKRWLKKAAAIQWDYKNIVKRKGVLVRLK